MNILIEGKERRFQVIEKQCVKLRMSIQMQQYLNK